MNSDLNIPERLRWIAMMDAIGPELTARADVLALEMGTRAFFTQDTVELIVTRAELARAFARADKAREGDARFAGSTGLVFSGSMVLQLWLL